MPTEYNCEIAKIKSTFLGFEDRGIFTATLRVAYAVCGDEQEIGGYAIRTKTGTFVQRTLKACAVSNWEKLVGRTIYVLTDETRRVIGIENLPTGLGERFLFTELEDEES